MEYDEIKKREEILKKALSKFNFESEERKRISERIENLAKLKTKMECSSIKPSTQA